MLFRERETVDPHVAGKRVAASLASLAARIVNLPTERRTGFEQVISQAEAAIAEEHVEFAEALASVLEVAVMEAEDDQRRRSFPLRRMI